VHPSQKKGELSPRPVLYQRVLVSTSTPLESRSTGNLNNIRAPVELQSNRRAKPRRRDTPAVPLRLSEPALSPAGRTVTPVVRAAQAFLRNNTSSLLNTASGALLLMGQGHVAAAAAARVPVHTGPPLTGHRSPRGPPATV
jgi:hypothetical protein